MVFIMHVCKKYKETTGRSLVLRMLVAFFLMQPLQGMTETQGINIRYVNGTMIDNNYLVNADIAFHFSDEVEKALTHGVPLQFDIGIKVKKHRRWLWDITIGDALLKYKLLYHPLSGYYIVTNLRNGERQQFRNLDNATGYLGILKNYPLITRNVFGFDAGKYYGLINVKLDIQSLPTPLRPLAYLSTQWRLSSPTYVWDIKP